MNNRKKFEDLFDLGGTSVYDILKDGNIFVENMRSRMDVSTSVAKAKCERAVEDGIFVAKIGLICPNDDRIIASFDSPMEFPGKLKCDICEAEEADRYEFETDYMKQVVYYKILQ